jgi:hypothetical protein
LRVVLALFRILSHPLQLGMQAARDAGWLLDLALL